MRQFALPVSIAVAGFSAVLLGALGAHGLRGVIAAHNLEVWQTAVRFQFWHALALTAVALLPRGNRARVVAAWAFALGMLFFCGSLYALALGAPRFIGFATPVGGLAFVAGWIALGVALAKVHASGIGRQPPSSSISARRKARL